MSQAGKARLFGAAALCAGGMYFASLFVIDAIRRTEVVATGETVVEFHQNGKTQTQRFEPGTVLPVHHCVLEKDLRIFIQMQDGRIGEVVSAGIDYRHVSIFGSQSASGLNFSCP